MYSRCILIWVDKDFALARGWFQGYPKKLGSIWMTRPVTVGSAGPRLEPGGMFGATLAANDRRLADVRLTLEEFVGHRRVRQRAPDAPLPVAARIAADGSDASPTLSRCDPPMCELGPAWRGTAEIVLHDAPGEELASLRVVEPIAAYWRQVGATFTGGERSPEPMR